MAQEFIQAFRDSKRPLSPLATLNGFHPRLTWDDTLHVVFRGFGPDFLAGALTDLFGTELDMAFDLAKMWVQQQGLWLDCKELVISDAAYGSLNVKGRDCKVLLLWMAP